MLIPHKYSAVETQAQHHWLMLNYRNQDRIFQSEAFIEAWDNACADERKCILALFIKPNPYELKRWVLRMIIEGLGQYPIKILRQLASYHGIKNYSRMSRVQLLDSLTEKGVADGSRDI